MATPAIKTSNSPATAAPPNPWGSSFDKLKEWDPKGAELLLWVGTNPWTSGVLPLKEVELISLAFRHGRAHPGRGIESHKEIEISSGS
jgi:hypothetical protein